MSLMGNVSKESVEFPQIPVDMQEQEPCFVSANENNRKDGEYAM